MKAVARMEWTGIPIDVGLHVELTAHWSDIKRELIDFAAARFPVFLEGHFNHTRFERFLVEHDLRWPFTARGRAAVDQQTFKDMARVYPEILPLQQTLHVLGKLRLTDLAIGSDGRNRTLLSPFSSRTSRNQPSTSRYVFGLAAWLRALIKPPPGRALACLDFEQQEFGIGAALSGDDAMMAAYATGDPYLTFAKQAGAVHDGATKKTHAPIRERFKSCALGVQYGMGDTTLSGRTGQSPAHARELIEAHRRTYPRYWRWVEAAVDFAMLYGRIDTVFGWRQQVGADANPRSLQNFPCQANGAEMLRLACSFATERGVLVGGPIHDALLIEASERDIDDRVLEARAAMADASRSVLGGFELRTKAKIIRYPDRYIDDRGAETWQQVNQFLKRSRL
jgi:hypothetical protein